MSYPLSATKLVTYRQCPQSYYFKYERGLKSPSAFGSAELGKILHKTLADIYLNWSYQDPKPTWEWCYAFWTLNAKGLEESALIEGGKILYRYYDGFVRPHAVMKKPLGIEGRITAELQFDNIEFSLSGRYDRLDWLGDGLELIDYKTTKSETVPDSIDVQLGLYYLALERTYQKSLKRLTLLYLRSGKCVSFDVTQAQREEVRSLISDLATKLRADAEWKPSEGGHCDRCTYQKYCTAKTCEPEPLPEEARDLRQVQLTLGMETL
jgi:putative RecB family exonuclease